MGGVRAARSKGAVEKPGIHLSGTGARHSRPLTRAERRKIETRGKLVDAAMRLFSARGYSPVTTADIASAADVGTGTFYLHFESKSEIFIALGKRCAVEIIRQWRENLTPDMTSAQMVNALLRCSVEFWRRDPARARLMLEGGPPFEAKAYVDLSHEIAAQFGQAAPGSKARNEALANMIVGLSFQLGRVILAGEPEEVQRIIEHTYLLIDRALA